MANDDSVILKVDNLVKYFPITQGIVLKRQVGTIKAVDDVSFELQRGETLGVVGESGCGKSTLARTLLRLEEPTSGTAFFRGQNILDIPRRQLRGLRRHIQIIFQDPYASLNPRMTVGDIVGTHGHSQGRAQDQRRTRVAELLELVGLNPITQPYPHRVFRWPAPAHRRRPGAGPQPKIIICDEPVSALDVSIQAQIINLFEDLQDEFGLTYIFIAHDLSVVAISPTGSPSCILARSSSSATAELYEDPTHPYTQALLSAVPIPDPEMRHSRQRRILLEGDVPSPADPPSGCRFRTRCWKAQDICAEEEPALIDRGTGHPSACHFAEEREVFV